MNIYQIAAGLIISASLVACGGDDPTKLMASAKEYLAKNDSKAAIIQIKNLLEQNPQSGEGRYLLGKALLDTGNAPGAEIELAKARELNFSSEAVTPSLAKALILQRKFRKATDDFGTVELGQPEAQADLLVLLSNAYAAQNMMEQSRAALATALKLQPANVDVLLAQARSRAEARDFAGASSIVDDVVAKSPGNAEAWKLKAALLLAFKGDVDGAIGAYQKAIEAVPSDVAAHTGLVDLLFQQNKLDEAKRHLEAMRKVAPTHPQVKFFDAQYAFQSKDFNAARDFAQQLLKVAPDNYKALQLAGLIELQLNSFVQAEVYFNKVMQIAPNAIAPRRVMAIGYLQNGQPEKALAVLTPVMAQIDTSPALMSLAGEVYLQNGDIRKAQDYFSRAAKLDPKDGRKRTSLALSHLIGGQVDSAMNELHDIAASDSGVTGDLALISANLRRGNYAQALKAIDGLEKKQPGNPLAANLRGKTQLALKDPVAARKSFESALKINPSYFPAIVGLAALDLAEKKPDDARLRFEAILAKDPKNAQVLLALADLRARSGGTKDDVLALINKAVEANPSDVAARLLQVEFLLRNRDAKQASSAAQNALAVMPNNPRLLDALGRTQLASNDFNQAITTLTKAASLQPTSPQPQMRLAEAYLADKNNDAAMQSLAKALVIKPDFLDAQRASVILDAKAGNYEKAVSTARAVQRQRPKEGIGFILEGDTYMAAGKSSEAITAYQSGLKQVGLSDFALKIHAAMLSANRNADAEKFAANWQKDHPKDAGFLFYLGDNALATTDYATAEKMYSAVVQLQPQNAPAFNNLAWVSGKLKKDKAVSYAEKAISLMPEQPAFIDTLAMLLLDQNDTAKALDWQKKAVALQPANLLFKLNLAKIYVKTGDKSQAKPILDELAKLGDKFAASAEVGQMLKSL